MVIAGCAATGGNRKLFAMLVAKYPVVMPFHQYGVTPGEPMSQLWVVTRLRKRRAADLMAAGNEANVALEGKLVGHRRSRSLVTAEALASMGPLMEALGCSKAA